MKVKPPNKHDVQTSSSVMIGSAIGVVGTGVMTARQRRRLEAKAAAKAEAVLARLEAENRLKETNE